MIDLCFRALIEILKVFSKTPKFNSLLGKLTNQEVSITKLIKSIGETAKLIIEKVHYNDGLASDFHNLSKSLPMALIEDAVCGDRSATGNGPDAAGPSGEAYSLNDDDIIELELDEKTENQSLETEYVTALTPLQFGDSANYQNIRLKHSQPPSKKTVMRIAHELASFSTASTLPCSLASSIFVRSDNSRMNFVKAVITG